jgi:hypothetical protein
MRRVEEPLHQLGHRQPRRLRGEGDSADAVVVYQLPSSPLRELGVTVHGERALEAARVDRIEADDTDLPHARGPLPDRTCATFRPAWRDCRIPITRGHPYSYRDSYRDGARRRPPFSGVATPLPATSLGALGGIRTPNLLIRRRQRGVGLVIPSDVTAGQVGCAVRRVVPKSASRAPVDCQGIAERWSWRRAKPQYEGDERDRTGDPGP